jgi:GNAT superfamily N-acetyltransferase
MNVRILVDSDLPLLVDYLERTPATTVQLVGPILEHRLVASAWTYFGAWAGERLAGVLAYFAVSGALMPACAGQAGALLGAFLEQSRVPRTIVGTEERVREILDVAPRSWSVTRSSDEVLMCVLWTEYREPPAGSVVRAGAPHAGGVARLMAAMRAELGLPGDPGTLAAQASQLVAAGRVHVALGPEGEPVAMSCRAAATRRYLHVGPTYCAPAWRRRGLASTCVAAVISDARGQGSAAEGATLFTGAANASAAALYGRMGFRYEGDWRICFLDEEPPPSQPITAGSSRGGNPGS